MRKFSSYSERRSYPGLVIEFPVTRVENTEELANEVANQHEELVNAEVVDLVPVAT